MDPFITPMLIGLGIQGIATLVGELMAGGKEAEAREIMNEAASMYDRLKLPELERAVAQTVGPTAFERITVDPAYKTAQIDALNRLAQISDEGGLTLSDKAAMNQILGDLAQRDAASRAATREEMQARGTLGAGAELASRLTGQQQTAQLASQRGMDIAGQAQQRALDAIMQRGALAGDIRGQEFGEQSSLAQARDAIARYNAAASERAQGYNLGLAQQQFQNKLNLTGPKANAKLGQATQIMGEAQNIRTGAAGFGAAGGQFGQAAAMGAMGGPGGSGATGSGYALDEYGRPVSPNRIGSYTTAGRKK